MVKFSNREYLFKFRKEFYGPLKVKEGDLIWSKIGSKVVNGNEYFMFCMLEQDPQFPALNEEFLQTFGKQWNGQYLVPCSAVRFDEENETLLRKEREDTVSKWMEDGAK